MIACQLGHKEIVKFLLTQKGIDLTIQNAFFLLDFIMIFMIFAYAKLLINYLKMMKYEAYFQIRNNVYYLCLFSYALITKKGHLFAKSVLFIFLVKNEGELPRDPHCEYD